MDLLRRGNDTSMGKNDIDISDWKKIKTLQNYPQNTPIKTAEWKAGSG